MSVFEVTADRISYISDAISFTFDRNFKGTLQLGELPTHQLVEVINDHVLRFVVAERATYVVFSETVEIHQIHCGVEVTEPFTLNTTNGPEAAAVLRSWYQVK
jgi:hypothetical protein